MCFVKFVTCHINRFAVKENVRNPNSVLGMRILPGRLDLTTLLQDFSVAAFA